MAKVSGPIRVYPEAFTRARILKGLSQRELARLTQYSIAYVSQLERGHRNPSPHAAQQFCLVLDKPFDALFYLVDVNKSKQEKAEAIHRA
ncbi:helix-turn-helix domain-containing protein [Alicyclobacillus fodiniaquatilis]|uniref:Helix-turn-helix domain-containing protein n=1 Tax=Alicyclobacillus fodiniaquatilis TaxID=1661150 RepID=A0ABW4JEL3_9BACL